MLSAAFCFLMMTSSLTFEKDVSGKRSEISWLVHEKEDLVEIQGETDGKKTQIVCNPSFVMQSYLSQNFHENDRFFVKREGNNLVAEHAFKGKTLTETFKIGDRTWVQDFSFGLKSFMMSNLETLYFEIINPKDMVMRTMVATKEEIDIKTFNNIQYRARRIKVTLDGFYKKFWKAELWFDTKTHNLLYYKANEGPSTPYTTLTLKELKK